MIRIDAALYKTSTVEKKSYDSLSDIHTDSRQENESPNPLEQREIETQTTDGRETPGKRQVVVQQQRNKNQPIIIKKPHLENRERLGGHSPRPKRPPKLKSKRPPLPKDGLPVSEEFTVASLAERRTPQATSFGNLPSGVTSRGNTALDSSHWIVPSSETQTSRTPSAGTPKEKPKRPPPPTDYPSPQPSPKLYRTPPSRIPPPKPPRTFMKSEKLNKTEQQMGLSDEKSDFERVGTHHPVPDFEEAIEEVLEENQVKRCHKILYPFVI